MVAGDSPALEDYTEFLTALDRLGIQTAREFHLVGAATPIPIADAFALLSNKLAVNRPKDRPHIDILKRFLVSESIVHFGRSDLSSRRRIATIKRYLQLCELRTIPADLFAHLSGANPDAVGRRFLVSHATTRAEGDSILDAANDETERAELEQLLGRRFAE